MVGFCAATQGAQSVDHWWDNGGNQIAFGRGGLGFVVINRGERPLEERLQAELPEGDYCNLWEGGLTEGAREGSAIRVAADGGALFAVPPMAAAMIQIHARPDPTPGDWRRTLIFIRSETQPGQDRFVRGGIDHGQASAALGRNCTPQNLACAVPIRHRNLRNPTTNGWKQGDERLDRYGAEPGQGLSDSGAAAEGTPLDWTTNAWPADWGARRTVAEDGYGEEPLNTWGHHYWMLDADLDCARTLDGWFEVKSYIARGTGREPDIAQPGAPWTSGNHFARCGWLNVFARGQAEAIEQRELPSE